MRIASRSYAVACPARDQSCSVDLSDPSQGGRLGYLLIHRQPQRLRLFKESPRPWAWIYLARPTASDDTGGVVPGAIDDSDNAAYAEKASPLERLPIEVLALILDNLSLWRHTERSFFALALSSPLLWTAVLGFINRRSLAASAPWADLPIVLADRQFNTVDWYNFTINHTDNSTLQRHSGADAVASAASVWGQRLPEPPNTFNEFAWVNLATGILNTAPPRKTRRTVHRQPRNVDAPLAGADDSTMLGAFKRSLCSMSAQSWTQDWVLRNMTKRLTICLTPIKPLRGTDGLRHARKAAAPYSPSADRMMPPRLHLKGAASHAARGCTCAVAAEDILSYYIMWFERPISTPYTGRAIPPDRGEWVANAFSIVSQEAHDAEEADPRGWHDITEEVRDKFAAIIRCVPGQRWGEPHIPKGKRGLRHEES